MNGSDKIRFDRFLAARSLKAHCSRRARPFFGARSGTETVDRFVKMWRLEGCELMNLAELSSLFSRK